MKIHVEEVICFPRELVFATYRDKLTELAAYLPNIEGIKVLEREELDSGDLRLLNLWEAKASEVPRLIRPFIKPSQLQWHDHANWHNSEWTCDWRTELAFFRDQIHVRGKNTYTEKGADKVTISISGDITVDGRNLPGVPRLVAGKVGTAVEKFVVNMITPNLRELNRGCERYLTANPQD